MAIKKKKKPYKITPSINEPFWKCWVDILVKPKKVHTRKYNFLKSAVQLTWGICENILCGKGMERSSVYWFAHSTNSWRVCKDLLRMTQVGQWLLKTRDKFLLFFLTLGRGRDTHAHTHTIPHCTRPRWHFRITNCVCTAISSRCRGKFCTDGSLVRNLFYV